MFLYFCALLLLASATTTTVDGLSVSEKLKGRALNTASLQDKQRALAKTLEPKSAALEELAQEQGLEDFTPGLPDPKDKKYQGKDGLARLAKDRTAHDKKVQETTDSIKKSGFTNDDVLTCNQGWHDFVFLGRRATSQENIFLKSWADALVGQQWKKRNFHDKNRRLFEPSHYRSHPYFGEVSMNAPKCKAATDPGTKMKTIARAGCAKLDGGWSKKECNKKCDSYEMRLKAFEAFSVDEANHAMKEDCLRMLTDQPMYDWYEDYKGGRRSPSYSQGWHGGFVPTFPDVEGWGNKCAYDDKDYYFSTEANLKKAGMDKKQFNLLARKAAFVGCMIYHPNRGIRRYSQGGVCARTVLGNVASFGIATHANRRRPRYGLCDPKTETYDFMKIDNIVSDGDREGCCWQYVHDFKGILCNMINDPKHDHVFDGLLPGCKREETGERHCRWQRKGSGISGDISGDTSSATSKGASDRLSEKSRDAGVKGQKLDLADDKGGEDKDGLNADGRGGVASGALDKLKQQMMIHRPGRS
eukprot:g2238.t1